MSTPTRKATAQRAVRNAASVSPRRIRQQIHHLAAAYRAIPYRTLLPALGLATGLIAAAAYSLNTAPGPAAAITLAAATAAHIAIRFPAATATTIVVTIASGATAPLAVLYAASATGGHYETVGAISTLTATLITTGIMAHRTSRGRPWLTTLYVALALTFVGPWLLIIEPSLGFGWPWLLATLVLILRSNLPHSIWTRFRNRPTRPSPTPTPTTLPDRAPADESNGARKRKQVALKHTNRILDALPDEYTVISDHPAAHQSHIVVGPTGVHVITSEKFAGRIQVDPEAGLTHDRIHIGEVLAHAAQQAHAVRAHLPRRTTAHAVTVIHDAELVKPTAKVALSTGAPTMSLAHPDALIATITEHHGQRLSRRAITKHVKQLQPAQPT